MGEELNERALQRRGDSLAVRSAPMPEKHRAFAFDHPGQLRAHPAEHRFVRHGLPVVPRPEEFLEQAVTEVTEQARSVHHLRGTAGPEPRGILQHPLVRVVAELGKTRVRLDLPFLDGEFLRQRPPSSGCRQSPEGQFARAQFKRFDGGLSSEQRGLDFQRRESFEHAFDTRPERVRSPFVVVHDQDQLLARIAQGPQPFAGTLSNDVIDLGQIHPGCTQGREFAPRPGIGDGARFAREIPPDHGRPGPGHRSRRGCRRRVTGLLVR